MNAKYRAKHCRRLAGVLALTASLTPLWAGADDGNLDQQLRIQQHKSRFQLMLEQVQESARRRAGPERATPLTHASAPNSTDLGDWTDSVRLHPVSLSDPLTSGIDSDSASRFRAQQAYDRDQQRILDHRQRQRALIGRTRTGGALGVDRFSTKRGELVRYKVQNRRQSLQRKLRR
jgi:hypothetical protein